jgi:PAS domain S-box-containing protein
MATRHRELEKGARPAIHRRPRTRAAPMSGARYADRDHLITELEQQLTQFRMQEHELRHAQSEIERMAEYYTGLFNSAPIGYVVLDRVGTIVEINQMGAALLQWKRDRLINESLARFVPKETLPDFLKHLRLCQSAQKQVSTELTLRTHEGAKVPVTLVSTCFPGQNGASYYRTAIIDISERRQTEQALQRTQKNYRNLVNSIEGIVWEKGPGSGGFTFVSQQAERILGYPVERWLREPDFWADRIHPEDRARILQSRPQALLEGKPFTEEFRMTTAQREVVWLRNSVSMVRDEEGRVMLQGVMVNITELKAAEQALREESRTLETLNQIGTSLAAELDLEKLAQAVTEAGRQVTGAQFGEFSYKHLNGHEEPFAVHTSGAPGEAFERLPQPHHSPSTPLAEMETEIIRIDDVLHDKRATNAVSSPRRKRRPLSVRSYLAVPVISRSGEVLGGLLFGHQAPGVFTERAQHLVAGIAAEAGIALDNARLYHAVSKSEAHFRELAEAMPQIVWTALPDGRFDYYNRRWYDYTGQAEGAAGEQDWMAFIHPEDCVRCRENWQAARNSNQFFQTECRLQEQKTGAYRWHLIRAVPIRDGAGRVLRWFGTCTDIDDQKRAEEEVRQLNAALERRVQERTAQLQASNRELEAFSYSVSHDLRAPLRSIDAFSQLVKEDYEEKLDEQGKQYLNIVGEASRQMARLIDDLLHLSRVTRSELRRRPVALSELGTQIITNLQQLEPQRHVEVNIAPGLTADGDERLLRIALENLLNNAWKFTNKQPQARIEIGAEVQEDQTVFFVRDNGAGFDMAYAGKLFGAFQRLHSNSEFPGHGIGLATVQRIINRHGGRVWAEGAVDRGATFYFTLPKEG